MSDFLAYHNGPKLGRDYEIVGRVGFYASNSKRSILEQAKGNRVWCVSRKIKPDLRICLDGAYVADDIEESQDGSLICWGNTVLTFEPPISLREQPWYDDVLRATASFVGFQKLSDEFAAKFAEFEQAGRGVMPEPEDEVRATEARLYSEGAAMRGERTWRGRQIVVRDECIRHYGAKCFVCMTVFGEKFGTAFAGLIEVHHEKPLAGSDEAREIDPVADCKPLCPNCHRMAHYGLPAGSARSIPQLQAIVAAGRGDR